PDIAWLEQIARVGVPVDVGPEGNLEQEIAHGNHSSAETFEEEVRGEAIADVVRGRALIFPLEQAERIRGIRISPVGVVEEKAKRRIVHDMTFGG
ncbi:unnamed protein product, partial [Laminaria digitata]